MEVILLERVENLGHMGEVVKVKTGFARNFLLPRKKALRATKENLAYFESQRVQLEAVNLKRKEEAQFVAAKMDGLALLMVRQAGEAGHLYGSVSARDIADAIEAQGFKVERSQVNLDQPLKVLGKTMVKVSLHPEVSVQVGVTIARSQEEAEREAKAATSAVKMAEEYLQASDAQEEVEEAEEEI
ncbi:MAG: 50S ribosomal protein L9 [Alphaproteobacteria bacterium]|nr:50S ribosomal protein L9 [Alphaproteobacteria bacterium]